ncbi:hypothetical protein QFC20_006898 [Naganishia adeliensis]|uniref:Uncharacterized protein n=1 Tax=Naganishia adeliensis TaxID=92952 RepID=A0ACC2V6A7_9TREE|nr:hypothetical protein QFC20_006898 [Naganishia adeliensis]
MRSTTAEEQRSRSPETTPTGGAEKSNAYPKSPSTTVSPLRAKDGIPVNENTSKRAMSAGSILGKRNASAMEQPELSPGENTTFADATFRSSGYGGKHRHQAIDQVVSSAFRRESMISPMDHVSTILKNRRGRTIVSTVLPRPTHESTGPASSVSKHERCIGRIVTETVERRAKRPRG